MILWLSKLWACSSKQDKKFSSKILIIILCQKVKNKVILIVKNFNKGEYGANGCLRAW